MPGTERKCCGCSSLQSWCVTLDGGDKTWGLHTAAQTASHTSGTPTSSAEAGKVCKEPLPSGR